MFIDFYYFFHNMVIMEYKKLPIHERIKELRKIHDWTQSNLAEKLGVENKMISYYENKKSIPNAETLVKIAEIFNVSIDYLLFDDAPKLPLERTGRNKLVEQMYDIDKLNEKDIEMITYMISSLITKNKMKELASAN